MRLHDSQAETVLADHGDLISRYIPREYLLSTVDASAIGIVICDRRFRYKALNRSAATIHNLPVEAHLGHKFHEILGNMADKVVPVWENVFASGQRLSNFELAGQLPKRSGVGHWILNLFPLSDRRGRVAQVGCFVIEIASGTGPQPPCADGPQHIPLSPREREIVRLVAEGNSNKQISSALAISIRTVETYRSKLMLKLQVPSIAHLVQYAIKNRIITL
jgi:DNA-binding CsgD family transcriptional regulator